MLTFRQWLSKQKKRDDPVGDLARDVLADTGCAGRFTPRTLRAYLVGQCAMTAVLDALGTAEREFTNECVSLRRKAGQ